jgi:hypothetical protein
MHIILDERETHRLGVDKLSLYDLNTMFGMTFVGFYDRYYDRCTKRHFTRWGYQVLDKRVLMLSIMKHGIKHILIDT